MKIVGVVQARMSSSRLPGKMMLEVLGRPVILRMLDRVARSGRLDSLCVATSDHASDDPLVEAVRGAGFTVYRGSLDNVLSRFWHAASEERADTVVRLTGDCPLHDPVVIDSVVDLYVRNRAKMDYVSNVLPPTFPDGLDTEVFSFEILDAAHREATSTFDQEHVAPWIRRKASSKGRQGNLLGPADFSHLRWTLDEPEDYLFVRQVYEAFFPVKEGFGWLDVIGWQTADPERLRVNAMYRRNEGSRKKPEAVGT
jgi:spore coat polysaccharide biosynthesis protein SpsF (cytidylyltransferase family)